MTTVLPPPQKLRNILEYSPVTGRLIWLERGIEMFSDFRDPDVACQNFNTLRAGRQAMTIRAHGYKTGRLFLHPWRDPAYMAHRVIWAMEHDEWPHPKDIVRHKNGKRHDNRLANLYLQEWSGKHD